MLNPFPDIIQMSGYKPVDFCDVPHEAFLCYRLPFKKRSSSCNDFIFLWNVFFCRWFIKMLVIFGKTPVLTLSLTASLTGEMLLAYKMWKLQRRKKFFHAWRKIGSACLNRLCVKLSWLFYVVNQLCIGFGSWVFKMLLNTDSL